MAPLSPNRQALNNLYKQAMIEGADLERLAEQYRMEAERAFADVGLMKTEGRTRALRGRERMLPSHERAVDVRTNTFKAMGDAKADHMYYLQLSQMYSALAQVKFAKAAALRA